jgi:hypothetical protein
MCARFGTGRGGNNVDYIACFRLYLSKFAEQAASAHSKTSSSGGFKPYSHNQRRQARPLHPWEFQYRREVSTFNPYIPLINTSKKLTVLDHARAKNFPRPHAGDASVKDDSAEVLALGGKYEAKVLAVCKKCADCLPLMDARYLEHEFRSCEGRAARTGFLPQASFKAILSSYCKVLSASEMGALLRAFKNAESPAPHEVNYPTFLAVCLAMKASSD